jgi:hypothetical protein
MCNAAAHLADHVVPDIPVRQWVMSAPFGIRFLLASRADAFTALTNIFIHQAFRWQRERARALGMGQVQSGALVTQHRFGSSLNLHTHLHAILPDGVFSRPDPAGRAQFHVLPAPTPDDLLEIAFNVHQCFSRWLGRRGLLQRETENDFSNETPERSALDACTQGSLGLGELVTAQIKADDRHRRDPDQERFEYRGPNPLVGESHGYNLFAGDVIAAGSHDARERLFRYCLRPQLSLERLSVARDGKIVYQVKATRRGKATQRIMAPLDFMGRLVALIPPPFHPLLRYFGVLAPHSAWRSCVVPENHEDAAKDSEHAHGHEVGETEKEDSLRSADARPDAVSSPSGDQRSPNAVATSIGDDRAAASETGRNAEQPRRRPRWYIDWATLLRRVHDVDALQCACGGRLRFKQVVTEPEVARSILRSMGLPDEPPPVPRARSPTFEPDPVPPDWD